MASDELSDHPVGNRIGTPSWPAVTFERPDWKPRGSTGALDNAAPRSARRRAAEPYVASIVPSICAASVQLHPETGAVADEASTHIARLDAELSSGPIPFTAILLRTESSSSSQIENLTSSAKALALSELGLMGRQNADQVVANVRAMSTALELSPLNRPLNEADVLAMHAELMSNDWPQITGRFRTQQVWIGGSRFSPHDAAFIPPHHSRVSANMADLTEFCARADIPVLVHAALAHAQFETIHPFEDGNGRTGRALLHAMLHAGGLTRSIPVPVSAGLLGDVDGYFAALGDYRNGRPDSIVRCVAEAAFAAVDNGRSLAADLQRIRQGWTHRITARRDSAIWKLTDLLSWRPVIDMPLVRDQLKITAANAQTAIDRLVDSNVLTQVGRGRRNRIWQCTEILDALDAFAERARR